MTESEVHEFVVHQEEDVVAGRRLAAAGASAVAIGAVGVFAGALLVYRDTGALQPSTAGPDGPRPGRATISRVEQTPIWQTRAGLDTKRSQAAELGKLKWVDRSAGVAQIPIDDAIEIVVEASK